MHKATLPSQILKSSALLALVAGLSQPASATHVQFLNSSGSSGVTVKFNDGTGLRQEGTTAGQYNMKDLDNGKFFTAYCTDLLDNIHDGEDWNTYAQTQTSNISNGLSTVPYPGGNYNTFAIDYIAKNFIAPPGQPAAQIAIWDLVEGGKLGFDGSTYTWDSSKFSVVGGYGYNNNAELGAIYTIEQAALKATGPSGSYFLKALGTPGNGVRPQDLAFADPIPEPAFYQMGVMLAGGGLMALRLRRRNTKG